MMGSVMKAAAGGEAPETIASQAREVGLANDVEGGGEGGLVVVFSGVQVVAMRAGGTGDHMMKDIKNSLYSWLNCWFEYMKNDIGTSYAE